MTGASRGIGAAIAAACAGAGARRLVLIARSQHDLDASAVLIEARAPGCEVLRCPCDVTDNDAVQALVHDVDALDVLVNCAGTNRPELFIDVTPDAFDGLFNLNVKATFFVTQAVVRRMLMTGCGGVIVNISSQMGQVGAPMRAVYCATKHAIEGLTKALAVELAPADIRVVSIAPTFVHTAMTAAQLDDPRVREELLAQIPLRRFATPDQVAAAVVYAASDDAALLTGSSLTLDGGWTAK